jgi:hypothetical protein
MGNPCMVPGKEEPAENVEDCSDHGDPDHPVGFWYGP